MRGVKIGSLRDELFKTTDDIHLRSLPRSTRDALLVNSPRESFVQLQGTISGDRNRFGSQVSLIGAIAIAPNRLLGKDLVIELHQFLFEFSISQPFHAKCSPGDVNENGCRLRYFPLSFGLSEHLLIGNGVTLKTHYSATPYRQSGFFEETESPRLLVD